MRRAMLSLLAFGYLGAGALQAQDISGNWQGVLRAGARELRVVFKISNDTGGPKALMYTLDQGPGAIPSNAITLQNSNIKIPFSGVGGTYEGKLNADGNSISGTWTQGQPIALNLTRATGDTAWAIPEPPAPPKATAADANPSFEVATIKLARPDDTRPPTIQTQYRRLLTTNKSVLNIICYAYSINPAEVLNRPDWLDTKYDIVGQADGEGRPNEQQWKIMLQKLLADRFKLTFHREKKEVAVYTLTVTKNGPKLAASASDPNGSPNLALPARGRFRARNATMVDFAGELAAMLDKPVIDQTNISGHYDFGLNWTPDEFQAARLSAFPASQDLNAEAPDLLGAVQAQLGLKLESAKAPMDVIVIDHVERPVEN